MKENTGTALESSVAQQSPVKAGSTGSPSSGFRQTVTATLEKTASVVSLVRILDTNER